MTSCALALSISSVMGRSGCKAFSSTKVLGIFARLFHRDGKDGYLKEMPRVMDYLRGACARYRDLAPLLRLLDALAEREPVAGYTF